MKVLERKITQFQLMGYERSLKWGQEIKLTLQFNCNLNDPGSRMLCSATSVVSDSLGPYGLPAEVFHPWNYPGKNTGVGCYVFLQGIFPAQRSNLLLLISLVS